jgi:hypothetical protein
MNSSFSGTIVLLLFVSLVSLAVTSDQSREEPGPSWGENRPSFTQNDLEKYK